MTVKQKNLYRKLENEYRKSGLLYIITFIDYIGVHIYGAMKNKKSTKDLYAIKNFVENKY
jgi:hypothetical protein